MNGLHGDTHSEWFPMALTDHHGRSLSDQPMNVLQGLGFDDNKK